MDTQKDIYQRRETKVSIRVDIYIYIYAINIFYFIGTYCQIQYKDSTRLMICYFIFRLGTPPMKYMTLTSDNAQFDIY